MECIITPKEVLEIAFSSSHGMDEAAITETLIISAQQKFIKPVLGDQLYARLKAGEILELRNRYIKPALAFYVKFLLAGLTSTSWGKTGIIQIKSNNFNSASEKTIGALKKQIRSEASIHMRRAIEYIENNISQYPDYNIGGNILNRISIASHIVL